MDDFMDKVSIQYVGKDGKVTAMADEQKRKVLAPQLGKAAAKDDPTDWEDAEADAKPVLANDQDPYWTKHPRAKQEAIIVQSERGNKLCLGILEKIQDAVGYTKAFEAHQAHPESEELEAEEDRLKHVARDILGAVYGIALRKLAAWELSERAKKAK